jgi:hypothetical protein
VAATTRAFTLMLRSAPTRRISRFLQRAEQLRLYRRRHLADLVEEDRRARQWPRASPYDEDWYRTSIEGTFGHAPEEQMAHTAGAPCADDEELRPGAGETTEQIAQWFAAREHRASPPSGTLQSGRRAIELSHGGFRTSGVGALDLARHAGGPGDEPARWHRHHFHTGQEDDPSGGWRREAGDERQGALRRRGPVEPEDEAAHTSRAPRDEDGARRAADDASGDAAHEEAAHRAMTAPPDHDDVRGEAPGFVEDGLDWCLVHDGDVHVGPAAQQ